jgi:chromosome segregation ATPase
MARATTAEQIADLREAMKTMAEDHIQPLQAHAASVTASIEELQKRTFKLGHRDQTVQSAIYELEQRASSLATQTQELARAVEGQALHIEQMEANIQRLSKHAETLERQIEQERIRREESDGKIFLLRQEAERRALITAALETRVEKLEQASQPAPKPEPELLRKIRAASPLAQRLQKDIAELHARTLARFGSDEPDKRGSDE